MSRRSKQSKDKRKADHDRKQRWGQQQKALHASQLSRDLAYYEERGLFMSQTRWSETASQVLWDSQNWRSEPEFRDLVIDPYQAGQAMNLAWQELEFDPGEYEKLSDGDKDDRNFELNAYAIQTLLTPDFKKDFLRRLERYRQRLRSSKRWEVLAQASLVQMVLETSDEAGEATWPECMLIYHIHYEAVSDYLRLYEATETALGQALQAVGRDSDEESAPLTEMERAQVADTLQQVAQQTPGLLDFLERAGDDMADEALNAVRLGELYFSLFTPEETTKCFVYFLSALSASGVGQTLPEDLPLQRRAEVDAQIDDAVADCLDEIDMPQRRAELYAAARAALQQQAREAENSPTSYAISLLPLLDDAEVPLADNEFFVAAITGEFSLRWHAEAKANNGDNDSAAA